MCHKHSQKFTIALLIFKLTSYLLFIRAVVVVFCEATQATLMEAVKQEENSEIDQIIPLGNTGVSHFIFHDLNKIFFKYML